MAYRIRRPLPVWAVLVALGTLIAAAVGLSITLGGPMGKDVRSLELVNHCWQAQAGQAGQQTLDGTPCNDYQTAGGGNDTLYGRDDNDQQWGEGDGDDIFGNAGADHLHGGPGSDLLDGGVGNDNCTGGDGNDTFRDCEG